MVIEGRTAGLWTRRLNKHERAHSVAGPRNCPCVNILIITLRRVVVVVG